MKENGDREAGGDSWIVASSFERSSASGGISGNESVRVISNPSGIADTGRALPAEEVDLDEDRVETEEEWSENEEVEPE
jgi:hypothetical protein